MFYGTARTALVLLTIVYSRTTADRQSSRSSKLQIHIPKSLASTNTDGFEHRESFFGNPPYGGSIIQQLYYADSDLCDSVVDVHGGYPRREVDSSTEQMRPWQSPFLLMVDRGGCTFVMKARHAQRAGAAGVIIADNYCMCDFLDRCTQESHLPCENHEPMMAGDGSGQDITIPSFMIFKHEADPIKEALRQDTFILMEMSWMLPQRDVVEYTVLSNAGDPFIRVFEEQFGSAVAMLGSQAQFTPHFEIFDGSTFNCRSPPTSSFAEQCDRTCTNAGRYCLRSRTSHNDDDEIISGADVIVESLRRLCIWKIYGSDGIGIPWWRYVRSFSERCDIKENDGLWFNDEECLEGALEDAGVEMDEVAKCMQDSGGLEDNVPNVWLDEQVNAELQYGVVHWPAMFVNGKPIRGGWSFDVAFEAICAGFTPGHAPEVCAQCRSCARGIYGCVQEGGVCDDEGFIIFPDKEDEFTDVLGDDSVWFDGPPEEWKNHTDKKSDESPFLFWEVGAVLVVLVLVGMGMFVHYKRSRRYVRDSVRGILSEYMQVDSLGTEESATTSSTYAPSTFIPFDYQQMEEKSQDHMT